MNPISIEEVLEKVETGKRDDLLKIGFSIPSNFRDIRFSGFFEHVYKSILNKCNIKNMSDFLDVNMKQLSNPVFFKGGTDLAGFLRFVANHYGVKTTQKPEVRRAAHEVTKLYFDIDDFYFLSDKQKIVFNERLVENKKTLEDIGQIEGLGITKERVRQISKNLYKHAYMYVDIKIFELIKEAINTAGAIQIEDLKHIIPDKTSRAIFTNLLKSKIRMPFEFNLNFSALYSKDIPGFSTIMTELSRVYDTQAKVLFSKADIVKFLGNGEKNIPSAAASNIISILLKDKAIAKIGEDTYAVYPKTKTFALEIFLATQKNGFMIYKKHDDMMKWLWDNFIDVFEGQTTKSNIGSLIEHNKNIVLWDWGVYTHVSNIKEKLNALNGIDLIDDINSAMKKRGLYNIGDYFVNNEKTLLSLGVDNQHALYTLARLKYSDIYDFNHTPWVWEKGTDNEQVGDAVAEEVRDRRTPFTVADVAKMFGMDNVRAMQLINYSNKIHKIGRNSYIHIDHKDQEAGA